MKPPTVTTAIPTISDATKNTQNPDADNSHRKPPVHKAPQTSETSSQRRAPMAPATTPATSRQTNGVPIASHVPTASLGQSLKISGNAAWRPKYNPAHAAAP